VPSRKPTSLFLIGGLILKSADRRKEKSEENHGVSSSGFQGGKKHTTFAKVHPYSWGEEGSFAEKGFGRSGPAGLLEEGGKRSFPQFAGESILREKKDP